MKYKYSRISILLGLDFNECPLKPIVNKRSRFYRPFADDSFKSRLLCINLDFIDNLDIDDRVFAVDIIFI